MIDISIIIPAYNLGDYIVRCVDSLLNQGLTNFEILLIDDGSTDNTGIICDELAIKDSRIKVTHKPNGGVNTARNIGLKIAKGRYITFIDGDDYLKAGTLKGAIQIIEKDSNIGFVQFREIAVENNNKDVKYKAEFGRLSDHRDMFSALIGKDPVIPGGLYGKLYRRSIISGIALREDMQFCEDMIALPEIIARCPVIASSGIGGYCYVQRSGSAMHSAFTPKKCLDVARLKNRLFNVAHEYDIESAYWWAEAVKETLAAWSCYGKDAELRAFLKNLQDNKKNVRLGPSEKGIVKMAKRLNITTVANLSRFIFNLRKAL